MTRSTALLNGASSTEHSRLLRTSIKLRVPSTFRRGAVECLVYVYDAQGRLLNTDSTLNPLVLSSEDLKAASAGLGFRQQISVPASEESFIRIGVRDVPTGRFGAVELPTSSVIRLPPVASTP